MPRIRSVAVFCGSRVGDDPRFRAAAVALGDGMAQAGLRLVFGGGRIGLMGILADAVRRGGGQATGVIPEFLMRREVAHDGLTELIVTDSMHSRKQRMFEMSDAFVALPGGLGTLDETIEIITWRQLGLHDKPILLCDVAGSVAPLLAAMDAAVAHGFAARDTHRLFEVVPGVPAVLDRLRGEAGARVGEPTRM